MITIYDHNTHPIFAEHNKKNFINKGRVNGAYTYSENIVKYHIPAIKELLKQSKYKNIVISTVETLHPNIIPKKTDLIICYLHENISRDIAKIQEWAVQYKDIDIIYISSRKNIVTKIRELGINAIFVPMSIDTEEFNKYKVLKHEKYTNKRVIYFGNKYFGKDNTFILLKEIFESKGWRFDYISDSMFNGCKKLSRDDIFKTIAKYKYGVGEGRCVLEMNALGLRTLICAVANQGIFTNAIEFEAQKNYNFSDGKIFTYSSSINKCIDDFDKAMIKSFDIKDTISTLKKQLKDILC